MNAVALETVQGRVWDAAVIGAGPAGAMLARQLARQGASVFLVDKAAFPRRKVCGCCLNQRAVSALEEAGLGHILRQNGAVPLRSLNLVVAGQNAVITLPSGYALSREVFDTALVNEAIAAGASFLPQTRADGSATQENVRTLRLRRDNADFEIAVQAVVVASGLGSKLSGHDEDLLAPPTPHSRIGAGTILESLPDGYHSETIYMGCGSRGYIGLVAVEGRRLNIAAALDAEWVKECGGLPFAAARLLQESSLPPITGIEELPWKGTPALTRRASRVSSHRLFILGDAAGYIEPFTGEGMAWALTSALALAPLVVRALEDYRPEVETDWEGLYHQLVVKRQGFCRILASLLRHPGWMKQGVRLLRALPQAAAPMVRSVNARLQLQGEP